MVTSQYPHQLYFDGGYFPEAYQDANGRWVKPSRVQNPVVLDCRAEAADSGSGVKTTTSADGQQVDFAFTVYLPGGTMDIPEGTLVEIKQGDYLVIQGTVIRYEPGYFHNILRL
jgi:hypothetical protein